MFQWDEKNKDIIEMIPMQFDTVKFFASKNKFTVVYNDEKIGIYLSKLIYEGEAKLSVPCNYEKFKRFNVNGMIYMAMKRDGKWGWVDWFTGAEKSEFIYNSVAEIPFPKYEQFDSFDKKKILAKDIID